MEEGCGGRLFDRVPLSTISLEGNGEPVSPSFLKQNETKGVVVPMTSLLHKCMAWMAVTACSFSIMLPVYAQESRNTEFFVRKAKQAMALGLNKQWKQALEQAESKLPKEAKSLSLMRRLNLKLWIALLWSKFHRQQGVFPPIMNIQKFESKSALLQYIKVFQEAIVALEKSKGYLKTYNRLFAKVMQRSQWQDQIYMQASQSMLRDLDGDIRTGKVYTSFLQFASHNWGKNKKIDNQLSKITKMVGSLKKNKVEVQVQAVLAKRQRKRLAQVMMKSQDSYFKEVESIVQRRRRGGVLMWTGIAMSAAGAGAIIGGGFLMARVQQSETGPVEGRLTASEKASLQTSGNVLLGVGGAVAGVGVVLAIVGGVIRPSKTAMEAAVIKTHNKHIEVERKELEQKNPGALKKPLKKGQSRLVAPNRRRLQHRVLLPPLPSCTRGGCVILGQW